MLQTEKINVYWSGYFMLIFVCPFLRLPPGVCLWDTLPAFLDQVFQKGQLLGNEKPRNLQIHIVKKSHTSTSGQDLHWNRFVIESHSSISLLFCAHKYFKKFRTISCLQSFGLLILENVSYILVSKQTSKFILSLEE